MKANKILGTRPRLLTESGGVFQGGGPGPHRTIHASIYRDDSGSSTLFPSCFGPALEFSEIAAAQQWIEAVMAEAESDKESDSETIEVETAIFGM